MPEYLEAPSCVVAFETDGGSTIGDGALVDQIQGQAQLPIQYYDGGSGARYAFTGELTGQVTLTDLYIDGYTSGGSSTIDITTNDVLPTGSNSTGIDIKYGASGTEATLLSFTVCTALFEFPSITTKGPALLVQGNYPYRIWDPDLTS